MREFLNELEVNGEKLNKETVDSIMAEHGKSIGKEKETIGALNQKITDLTTELETTKTNSKNELETLKADSQKAIDDLNNNFNGERKSFAIEKELFKVKAKDNKDVLNNLDLNKIEYKDGVLSGLDEQLKEIKEKKSYLFDLEQESKPLASGLSHGQDTGKDLTEENKMRKIMGLQPKK